MVPRYWLAPILLSAVQAAPIGLVPDSNGRLRVAVGAQWGRYEDRDINCAGDVVAQRKVRYRTVGGEAEAWIKPTVRVMGYGGSMTVTGTSGSASSTPYQGSFAGGLAALENRKVGIGLGLSIAPHPDRPDSAMTLAMPYFRFGPLDRVHLRLDLNGPGVPGGPPERFRLSLARGFGMERRTVWRIGVGSGFFPADGDVSAALSGELGLALNRYLDLGLAGSFREPSGGNAGAFIRLHLGGNGRKF